MAAMTTVLKRFSGIGNSITYTTPNHTAVKSELMIQKRKVPVGNQVMLEDSLTVILATTDSVSSESIPEKVSISMSARRPKNGAGADMTQAIVLFRDYVASDEFQAMIDAQAPLVG